MHAGVARETFKGLRVFEQLFRLRLGCDRALRLRILFHRRIKRDVELVRNHARDPIGIAIRQTHHAAYVAHDALRFQFSKRNDLCDAAFTVFLADVFQDFAAARFAKIDIDVGRRHASRI